MHRRRRFTIRSAVLLVSAAALAVGTVAAPAGAQEVPAARGGGHSGQAPPLPEIKKSEVFNNGPRHKTASDGTEYSPLDEPLYIAGHDNGQSTLYDNGKGLRFSYWTNGDTGLTRPNGDGKTFLGNTAARTTDLDMSDNVSSWTFDGGAGGPREAVVLNAAEEAWNEAHLDADPDTAGCQPGPGIDWMQCGDEYAIWGGGIVADVPNKRILSFYGLVDRYHAKKDEREDPNDPTKKIPCTDEDVANRVEECRAYLFDGDGIGIAVWTETTRDGDGWKRMPIKNAVDTAKPTALWPFDEDRSTSDRKFDNGTFAHGGYVYTYGCPGFWVSECGVARASLKQPGDVLDRNAWRFYAGEDRDKVKCPEKWSADVACVAPAKAETESGATETLSGGAAGTSYQWNPALRMFLSIYNAPFSDELHYRVAHRPEGPWSKAGLLGKAVPAVGEGFGSVSYAGFAHPEYAERNGLVQYITYAHTTGFLEGDMGLHKVEFKRPRH